MKLHFQINLGNEDSVRIPGPESIPPKKSRKLEAKKESIPKTFISHIRSLGFQEADAIVLYENKDDWMGISRGRLLRSIFVCELV